MNFNIVDIGKTRLEKVLFKDKATHPDKICEVIKSDLTKVLNNYMDIQDEIEVIFNTDNDCFNFQINFSADRLKTFGCLPNML